MKKFICPYIERIGNGDQLFQLWSLYSSLYYAHVVNTVVHSGSKRFLRHASPLTGSFDSFSQCDLIHTAISF